MLTWCQAIVVGYTHLRRQTNKLNSCLEKKGQIQFSFIPDRCLHLAPNILSADQSFLLRPNVKLSMGLRKPSPISLVWCSVVHPP